MQCELCIAFDERCAFEHSHFVVVVVVIVLYFGLVRLDITKKHIHFTSWTTCVRAQVSVHLEIERHVLFQNKFFFFFKSDGCTASYILSFGRDTRIYP